MTRGTYNVTVTANDGNGGTVDETFELNITNSPPTVLNAIDDQSFSAGTPFNFSFASNTFTDVDGDSLTYTTSNLPSGLAFDSNTRTFTSTSGVATGTYNIFVTADDGNGGNRNDIFQLDITNNAPTLANAIADQTIATNSLYSYTIASNTFDDADGDALTYTATLSDGSALPAGLSFDGTDTISGTPTVTGSFDIKVTADDGNGGTVDDIFQLNIVTPTTGTTSNDNINATANAEIIDGLDGVDRVIYSTSNAGVTVNLDNGTGSGGYAEGDILINIERLTGSGYDDNLRGHNGVYNYFYAGNGNDTLTTGTSGGYMSGENGNDTLIGDLGRDRLVGGSGEDYLEGKGERDVLAGGNDNDTLIGGADNDYLRGDGGDDELNGTDSTALGVGEIDLIYGGTGADTFILGDGTNVFYNDGNNSNQGKSDFARIRDYNQGEGDVVQLTNGFDYYLGSSPNGTVTGTAIFIDNDGVSGLSANDEMIANLEGVTLTSGQIVNGVTAGFTFV